jgi:uncharacterized protein with PQ loop repeat
MTGFRILGFALFAYAVYAIILGQVYGKTGRGAGMVSKLDSPDAFWTAVVIYFGLSIVLCAVF